MEEISRKDLQDRLKEIFSEIFPVKDIFLISYSVTARKAVMVTIMKKGGVSIDDCKFVSTLISKHIPDDYDLQVQSPGIGFEIKEENFNLLELFLQTPIKIFYKDYIQDKPVTKEIEGILTFIDKTVSIKVSEKNKKNKKEKKMENESIFSIDLNKVIKIKTTFYPEEI